MKANGGDSKMFARCERQFRRLSKRIGKSHRGEIVAIEPDTGSYFVGKDTLEVALKARRVFPRALFGFFRVGFKTVHKLRRGYD
ncbi:MAG: hypothetical protein A3G34_05815 [Candidatus Lindowbacteria bacterium RIFCSPLOWO2_12_FULL_62_27]|nr:MAG: hypothetical protein A3G34_05815 [Candidatus Lindowbacteria bacterium RIFCSPLOWO2_12_FULL_62_27]OGH63719.1 MAG: hypothetical protein A3I06_09195 [Candidatus Lindowbacteria bacterium RIFCSPLOWO2_02_FULL_62_12]